MSIDKELLDRLMEGLSPGDLFGKTGILSELTKALAERALSTEMDLDLDEERTGAALEGQNQPPNRRNGRSQKTPEVKTWLDKHPRFKLHFTPTSASWLNLVESFFAEVTSRRIRRGSYSSVDDREAAIYDYLAHHNERPKPFKWTKTVEDILTRERRALDRLDEIRGNR